MSTRAGETSEGDAPRSAVPVPPDALATLAALVVKRHVRLGGLPPAQLELALALAAACLPPDATMDEKGVNHRLKAALAGAASFLDTDHVELRRWLVDAGWLVRDGYGREYRRAPVDALSAERRRCGAALQGLDVAPWAEALRQQHQARSEARRRAWQARSEGPPPGDGGSSAS